MLDPFFIKLCWKNLWRNPRRALITLNAIALSVMVLVWVYNYYDGFHEQVIQNAIRYQSGHIVIAQKGYAQEHSSQVFLKDVTQIESALKSYPEVKAFSTRVTLTGFISSPYGSANVFFHGVNPASEMATTSYAENLTEGDFLKETAKHPIVLGKDLARLLKAKIGSKVVVLTQGVDGSVGNQLFRVAGIFDTSSDADRSLAFIDISDGRALLSIGPTAAQHISVVLKSQDKVPMVQSRLKSLLSGYGVEVLGWKQVQKHLMAMIELNRSANRILLFIIMAVASLGIANSILMGILERTREFGVMSAIGTDRGSMMGMVVLETALLSIVGTALGTVLGVALTLYFGKVGFDLKWLTSQPLEVNGTVIQTISYPTVRWMNVMLVVGVILFLSLLSSFIPVRHVSKIKTVDALRSH